MLALSLCLPSRATSDPFASFFYRITFLEEGKTYFLFHPSTWSQSLSLSLRISSPHLRSRLLITIVCGCLSICSFISSVVFVFVFFRAFLCSTGDHLFNSLLCSCSVGRAAVAAGNNITLVKVLQIRFAFRFYVLLRFQSLRRIQLCIVCLAVSGRSTDDAHSIALFKGPRTILFPVCVALAVARLFVCFPFFTHFTVVIILRLHYTIR